jgi:hypothetical protein
MEMPVLAHLELMIMQAVGVAARVLRVAHQQATMAVTVEMVEHLQSQAHL